MRREEWLARGALMFFSLVAVVFLLSLGGGRP
jgi:hypothetical protein